MQRPHRIIEATLEKIVTTKARVANVAKPRTSFPLGGPWGFGESLNHKNIAILTTEDIGQQDLLWGLLPMLDRPVWATQGDQGP